MLFGKGSLSLGLFLGSFGGIYKVIKYPSYGAFINDVTQLGGRG